MQFEVVTQCFRIWNLDTHLCNALFWAILIPKRHFLGFLTQWVMSCVGSSSRGVVTMKRNNTDLGPIEIIRYFGGVPIFRTQIVFKLKKLILQNVMISMWRMAVVCAFWSYDSKSHAYSRHLARLRYQIKILVREIKTKKNNADL